MFRIPAWLLNQECTIYLMTGNTATGVKYETTGTTYKCRIEFTSRRQQSESDQEKIIRARIFLPHNANVNEFAKVVFDSTNYKIVSIAKQYALNSLSHIELEVY